MQGRSHQLLEAGQAWEGRARPGHHRCGEEGVGQGGGQGRTVLLLLLLLVVIVFVHVEFSLALLGLLLGVAGGLITRLKFITADIFSIMIYVIT